MFPMMLCPGHLGLFISVVGKNKTWLDVAKFTAYSLKRVQANIRYSCFNVLFFNEQDRISMICIGKTMYKRKRSIKSNIMQDNFQCALRLLL